jgi:hypothetical protein
VLEVVLGVGLFLSFLEVSRCRLKKKTFSTRKSDIIVQFPPPSPSLLPIILRDMSPPDSLYCNKILAISCKGQRPIRVGARRSKRAAHFESSPAGGDRVVLAQAGAGV